MSLMQRQPTVDTSRFAMVTSAEIPRASFNLEHTHKTTFSAGKLVPMYCEEVLPGDSFNLKMTAFVRMATPIYPIMDNLYLESFFFFVPTRIIWDNFRRFMGEQPSPGDSTAFTVPQIVSPSGGFAKFSIYDYFGLPCAGQILPGNTISINALPLRAYRAIYNEWFRDQNLITLTAPSKGDGPDLSTAYDLQLRAKAHDYFTSALPFAQKGNTPPLLISGTAKVNALTTEHTTTGTNAPLKFRDTGTNNLPGASTTMGVDTGGNAGRSAAAFTSAQTMYPTNLYADLASATFNTINALRQSFAIQRLLERDARGGTRYTETIRAHFKVISPDARLQRPEYLGGGKTAIQVMPVLQQSATGVTGGTTPIGTLGGVAVAAHNIHGFAQAFTEHGYVIGICNVRADVNYQQGIRRLWSRSTRYDFYWPAFAHLGEQVISNRELYADGNTADADPFGFQERWAEYRYHPSTITGAYNSTGTTPLDSWHLAQRFTSRPTLNKTFIEDGTEATLQRALAIGALAANQQFICDFLFTNRAARPMPIYSTPGMMDHF